MRRQLSNSIYGLLDYGVYPIGMLIVAPFVLRNLGVAQYGVWTVTASIVNIGSILASGFGDANTQRVALRRGAENGRDVVQVVRAALGIHLVLGLAAGLTIWCFASFLAVRLAPGDTELENTGFWSIRIAAALTVIRSLETVCVSTQKAYERYGDAVRVSIVGRLLSLAAAAVLAATGHGLTAIMAGTMVAMAGALVMQIIQLQQLIGMRIRPSYEQTISRDLLRFGAFTWILSAAGVVFGQADRLIGGTSQGAAETVAYALCAQLSQPVYGLTAAGLHFLFPFIASRRADKEERRELKRILLLAIAANLAIVLIGSVTLLACSDRLLRLLSTQHLAQSGFQLMPWVLAGSSLLALSVTGSYAMVALGKVRAVASLNVAACLALLVLTAGLLLKHGVRAIAEGRIAFALIAVCVYIPLCRELGGAKQDADPISMRDLAEET